MRRVAASLDAAARPEKSESIDPLSDPPLPPLLKRDRARLLVQSPFRIHFYWTLGKDPYSILKKILRHNLGNYGLFIRLIDLDSGRLEMYPAEESGNWWFDADPEHSYRAEIGFFAPFRPFIRIAFSNTVRTPSVRPSTRPADASQWRIRANDFARVLAAAGYNRDAAVVASAGEYPSDEDASDALFYVLGFPAADQRFAADEVQFALRFLAAGNPLESLRWKIGATLFSFLQRHLNKLASPDAIRRINERFPDRTGYFESGPATGRVAGSSIVHFPAFGGPRQPRWLDLPFEFNISSSEMAGRKAPDATI